MTILGTMRLLLVDSGSVYSILPVSFLPFLPSFPPQFSLTAVNGSRVRVYARLSLPIKLHTLSLKQEFLIADVFCPILGIDFLITHGALLDPLHKTLTLNKITIPLIPYAAPLSGFPSSPTESLKQQFPDVFNTRQGPLPPLKHNITHTIHTFAPKKKLYPYRLPDIYVEPIKNFLMNC